MEKKDMNKKGKKGETKKWIQNSLRKSNPNGARRRWVEAFRRRAPNKARRG